jgi:hypothetical protein
MGGYFTSKRSPSDPELEGIKLNYWPLKTGQSSRNRSAFWKCACADCRKGVDLSLPTALEVERTMSPRTTVSRILRT